jgi:hypothetical protein
VADVPVYPMTAPEAGIHRLTPERSLDGGEGTLNRVYVGLGLKPEEGCIRRQNLYLTA